MGRRTLTPGLEDAIGPTAGPGYGLLTLGHGTLPAEEFASLVTSAGIELVLDIRTVPHSRRNPQFDLSSLGVWLPPAGVSYRWERRLGGFRKAMPDSPNVMLRHRSFRGYADYMATEEFRVALGELVVALSAQAVAIMCSESLWWRCHRRLVADALVLLHAISVGHLDHRGRVAPHRVTEGVRVMDGVLRYDVAV